MLRHIKRQGIIIMVNVISPLYFHLGEGDGQTRTHTLDDVATRRRAADHIDPLPKLASPHRQMS